MTEIPDSSTAAAADYPSATLSPPATGPHRFFVHLAVIAAVLITLIAVGLLGWRWSRVQIPDMAIIVRGGADAHGTEVTVHDDDEHREVARGHLGEGNDDFIVMIQRSHQYTVRATLGTHVLLQSPVPIPESGNVMIDLKVPPEFVLHPATAPATKPATPVEPAP